MKRQQPKWQRARVASVVPMDPPGFLGREVWVQCVRPELFGGEDIGGRQGEKKLCVLSALVMADGRQCRIVADCLELLARSPEDFADSVPLVGYEKWIRDDEPRDVLH